jgi:hypothetical protein
MFPQASALSGPNVPLQVAAALLWRIAIHPAQSRTVMLHTLDNVYRTWLCSFERMPVLSQQSLLVWVPATRRLHPRHHDGAARLYGFDHTQDVEQALAFRLVGGMRDVETACRHSRPGSARILVRLKPQRLRPQRLKHSALTK